MNLPGAPVQYLREIWQGILNEIRRSDAENFKKGQHIHLARGEIIYIKRPDGTEVALTLDSSGNWLTPNITAAVTETPVDYATLLAWIAELRRQLIAVQSGFFLPIPESPEFMPVPQAGFSPMPEQPFWTLPQ